MDTPPLSVRWPTFGLRLACGPLELRAERDDDFPELVDLAAQGVENDDMPDPFLVNWQHSGDLFRTMASWYWSRRGEVTPERWVVTFVVRREGEVVGIQEIATRDYLALRSINTGSWLGREFHRQGVGTLMRQMVCMFGFDHLDAEEMASGWYAFNRASAGVSAKVGYRETGRRRQTYRGGWAEHVDAVVTPETVVRPQWPLEVEGVDAFREFIGLDAIPRA